MLSVITEATLNDVSNWLVQGALVLGSHVTDKREDFIDLSILTLRRILGIFLSLLDVVDQLVF